MELQANGRFPINLQQTDISVYSGSQETQDRSRRYFWKVYPSEHVQQLGRSVPTPQTTEVRNAGGLGFQKLGGEPGVGRGPCPVRHSDRGVSRGPAIHGSVWLGVFNHV